MTLVSAKYEEAGGSEPGDLTSFWNELQGGFSVKLSRWLSENPVEFCPTDIEAIGYPRKQYNEQDIESKYNVLYSNNVWSAHAEKDIIEGRNVEGASALLSTNMHETYCN